MKIALTALCLAGLVAAPALAQAPWKPTRPVEFIAAAGPGGGTDVFARTVQSIMVKHGLVATSVTVSNKGGGSGAEAFVQARGLERDPHKLVFGTSNEWMLPLVAKVAWKYTDLTPRRGDGAGRVRAVGEGRRALADRRGVPGRGEGGAG